MSLDKIEEHNMKWLEYMNSVDVSTVKKCPEGHDLVAYMTRININDIIITCPVGYCDYYDYSTFIVPVGTQLSLHIDKSRITCYLCNNQCTNLRSGVCCFERDRSPLYKRPLHICDDCKGTENRINERLNRS